jgi:GDP-L-fucose synthase
LQYDVRTIYRGDFGDLAQPWSSEMAVTFARRCADTRFVFLAAAHVGGLYANQQDQTRFLHENWAIQRNVMHACAANGVTRLVFLGSSCVYPNNLNRPIVPDDLGRGPLEETNKGYALSKLAGLTELEFRRRTDERCAWIALMPCNLYGPNDNWTSSGHFLTGITSNIIRVKRQGLTTTYLQGTGRVRREILHVSDFAQAAYLIAEHAPESAPDAPISDWLYNVGSGVDRTIRTYARHICHIVGFSGRIKWAGTASGTARKLLDSSAARRFGWAPKISVSAGLQALYHEGLLRVPMDSDETTSVSTALR